MLPDDTFDLAQLAAAADVSPRTVRYYIQQGLLPAPESRGPGAHYGAEHLDRLRVIRRLQREHLPLAEIRRRLEGMEAGEIGRLAGRGEPAREAASALEYVRRVLSEGGDIVLPDAGPLAAAASVHRVRRAPDTSYPAEPTQAAPLPPAPAPARKSPPVPGVERSQWDRITLAPDVELHLRRPLSREQNRQVERLLEAARRIFQEDVA